MERREVDGREEAGYRPVWDWQRGHLEEMLVDIAELLLGQQVDIVASISSITWLVARNFLCRGLV
ncbi:hypothetical protein N7490_011000 [Penicillium lividum]|nr:hypothetical protein N7490_011000 [Penicillium lividum]